MPIPGSLVSLDHAYVTTEVGSFVSVMGTVTDVMTQSMTKNNEYIKTFSLIDPPLLDRLNNRFGMQVRFFTKKEQDSPIVNLGDVVVLRRIRKMNVRGRNMLVANSVSRTETVVFAQDSIPEPGFAMAFASGKQMLSCVCMPSTTRPAIDEQMYAIELKDFAGKALQNARSSLDKDLLASNHAVPAGAPSGPAADRDKLVSNHAATTDGRHPLPSKPVFGLPSAPPAGAPTGPAADRVPPRSKKFSIIKQVQVNRFYDLVVQVVKIFPSPYGTCELYVTDYTSNGSLYNYPDPDEEVRAGREGDPYGYIDTPKKKWPGPWGQMVLQVELHHPHSGYVFERVKEGDSIELKNVRVKLSRENKLEANLFPDERFPDEVGVAKVDLRKFDEGLSLMDRKDKYWKPRKRHLPEDSADRAPATKKSKKKKKAEKQKLESALRKASSGDTSAFALKTGCNKHVRCTHQDVRLSSLKDLIDMDRAIGVKEGVALPYINQRRRAAVRAVGFYPLEIEDFAKEDMPILDQDDDVDMSDDESSRWQWDFFLLLEDISSQKKDDTVSTSLWVHVDNLSAQYLLKLDASDLRHDGITLHQLRERLAILWGNLEEISVAGEGELSNIPFECCIVEYGQQLDPDDRGDQYEDSMIRLHGMTGTTIIATD